MGFLGPSDLCSSCKDCRLREGASGDDSSHDRSSSLRDASIDNEEEVLCSLVPE